MAMVNTQNVAAQAHGFGSLSAMRQVGLMVGLAASVALGIAVALWSQSPNYSLLYSNLSAKDIAQVTDSLDKVGISYQLEHGSTVMVPASEVHRARIQLATQGIPNSSEVGYELLDKEQGFGTSSFLQKANYQRALEGELAQSIATLNGVESARVHLAIPKQSVFVRNRSKPAVSVLLNLYPGRVLDEAQIAGIVNLVASSVSELEAEQVTVVDQKGRLLSSGQTSGDMALSVSQFDYSRRLEERYTKRIIDIISPIVGADGVRAQVVADIDFTALERTSESYLPEQLALRSEQVSEEYTNESGPTGVPGALSNQPPAGGSTTKDSSTEGAASAGRSSSQAVRNYELDRTISHSRHTPGSLRRISVAVVVDYLDKVGEDGTVERVPLSDEVMARIQSLVREAVGFDEGREDSINVVNTSFLSPMVSEPLPEPPIWEQSWVHGLAKQVLGGLLVLFIAFGILRPMMRNLTTHGGQVARGDEAEGEVGQLPMSEDRLSLTNQSGTGEQQLLQIANSMVQQDPKRVAQVVKTWVAADE